MTMSGDGPDFVKWSEQFISQERGRRIVHYYLEDASGDSHLAVVGTERSLRHMLYVVSEKFCQVYGSNKLGLSSLKWRSRREVVDWLGSFLPAKACDSHISKLPKCTLKHDLGVEMEINRCGDTGDHLVENMDDSNRSDIIWSGASWTCGKQLRHYQAFCRNGTTVIVHSFVLVMSEEENRYLAYLEDMYENKKGEKKVKVRWFHQNQEFACAIPAPAPHPSEVFITPFSQVISAECVDDIAVVLTPEHYEKCLDSLSSAAGVRLCFRQYIKNKFKLFDLRTLRGYFNQAILSRMGICDESGKGEAEIGYSPIKEHVGHRRTRFVKVQEKFLAQHFGTEISGLLGHITTCQPAYQNLEYDLLVRRPLSMKFVGPRNWLMPPFEVGEKIEHLCQDSGIRGCWFKCTVLRLSLKKLKVRYDDVQNVDGYGNLEEWVPAFRTAAPDRLGMRCSGRLTIRPCPKCIYLLNNIDLKKGMAVDVQWNDGWWEGIIVELANSRDDNVQVYLPGEDIFLICELKRLRMSKDWVGDQWVDINAKPDILSAASSVSPRTKLASCSVIIKGAESGSSVMSDQEFITAQPNLVEDKQAEARLSCRNSVQLDNESQSNPRKRHREENAQDGCGVGIGIGDAES
ncbi:Agenet domain [Musa troglodytarum]|uniref:Agenet domain n=1 Tax=Musa troglodytarum TaxID=320322 RepID=A0A9E7JNC1_9LILI|nr:Agenet domain [Musa troglodytarum]URD87402.1 Agenet domain [Musa troglodytarum]URD87403.1 Agenet domain [Musa troglodytarum]